MRVLLVGGGAREHALGIQLHRSGAELAIASPTENPGLAEIARWAVRTPVERPEPLVEIARNCRAELAVIGPEAPLAGGVADALRAEGIPVFGPGRAGARIESSKRWCREFLSRNGIHVSPRTAPATTAGELDRAIGEVGEPFVLKPVSLTSGKGVLVQGADFATKEEGVSHGRRMLAGEGGPRGGILVEERLEGEEFSLMAFVVDGRIYPMPAVQDYKRALEGGGGGNTGGMGSYSQRDHRLPFLSTTDWESAVGILRATAQALAKEGISYRGVLYGGFMLTARGPRLLEYNARFGDPEALNVLTQYEPGDFTGLLHDIASGIPPVNPPTFRQRATVVKYVVPEGYGGSPQVGAVVEYDPVAIEDAGVHLLMGAVSPAGPGRVRLGTSRGLALVGEASAIWEASERVEEALHAVKGSYYVRHDIATKADLARRVEHMRQLLAPGAKVSPLPLSVAAPTAPAASHATQDQVV